MSKILKLLFILFAFNNHIVRLTAYTCFSSNCENFLGVLKMVKKRISDTLLREVIESKNEITSKMKDLIELYIMAINICSVFQLSS